MVITISLPYQKPGLKNTKGKWLVSLAFSLSSTCESSNYGLKETSLVIVIVLVIVKVIGHLSGDFSSASTAKGTISQGNVEGW